jgi:hypothetical protein
MSKPRFKGSTIGVRLLLPVDAEVRRLAELAGVSPSVYLSRLIEGSLGRSSLDELRAAPRVGAKIRSSACRHSDKVLLGGGLARCKACLMTRGADGVWRE